MTDWVEKTLQLFASSLHGNLKSRVRGHVYCAIEGEDLVVSIAYKDVTYSYRKDNILDCIHHNVTVNEIAKEIEYDYSAILRKIFFINGGVKHGPDGLC